MGTAGAVLGGLSLIGSLKGAKEAKKQRKSQEKHQANIEETEEKRIAEEEAIQLKKRKEGILEQRRVAGFGGIKQKIRQRGRRGLLSGSPRGIEESPNQLSNKLG